MTGSALGLAGLLGGVGLGLGLGGTASLVAEVNRPPPDNGP